MLRWLFNRPKFRKGEKIRVSTSNLFGATIDVVKKVIKKEDKFLYIVGKIDIPLEENKLGKIKIR